MVSFSIDFLTGNDLLMDEKLNLPLSDSKLSLDDSGSDGGSRRTPSPTPSDSTGSNSSENAESIAEVLLSLDKQTEKFADPSKHEKPPHSYIALISMAILSSPERRMLLSDIYQYIMDTFPYYDNKEKAWRNSIRHNLSLNECFVKSGRSDNGKGNYWSIHPACVEDFAQGDFRRRQARRRARKCMKEATPVPDMHIGYRYNLGYVPMTSSQIGYHPYATPVYYPPPTSAAFARQPMGPGPYYASPAQNTMSPYPQSNHRRSVQGMQQLSPDFVHGLQPISYSNGVQHLHAANIPQSPSPNSTSPLPPLSPSPLSNLQPITTGNGSSLQPLSPSPLPPMQHLPLWFNNTQ